MQVEQKVWLRGSRYPTSTSATAADQSQLNRLVVYPLYAAELNPMQQAAAARVSPGPQVIINEEVDPTLVIKRLKQEIRDLKDEIRSCPCNTTCIAPAYCIALVSCVCIIPSKLHWLRNNREDAGGG